MKFNLTETLFSIIFALDCIEHDLLGIKTNHSKKVSYICVDICSKIGLNNSYLFDVATCTILHDNALTDYIHSGFKDYHDVNPNQNFNLAKHCILEELNCRNIHFSKTVTGSIFYHHENCDKSGLFGKKSSETPLNERLTDLSDVLDCKFSLNYINSKKILMIKLHLKESIDKLLCKITPQVKIDYSSDELISFARIFADIIDYKSEFTQRHSLGVADKAIKMGKYYSYDKETCAKMYFAGAIHDIGKLVVDADVLEKPGKLTSDEYKHIQTHVYYTYLMLRNIEGLEDVASWAYSHHEKLDGSGYPFGKKANELGKFERLFACIDIYQALTEKRPYKDAMSHEKAIFIMKEMVENNKLDSNIVNDIDLAFSYKEVKVLD